MEGADPVHLYPGSTVQEAEQPFPEVESPSSHCSEIVLFPSPQTSEQTLGFD